MTSLLLIVFSPVVRSFLRDRDIVDVAFAVSCVRDLDRALREMREHLGPEDADLRTLTDSAIGKLEAMTEEDYAALDLIPDFDEG